MPSEKEIYEKWIKGLSFEERAQLSPDLLEFADDHGRVSGGLHEEHDPASMAVGDANDKGPVSSEEDKMKYEIVDRLITGLLDSANPRISALGLCYAMNLPAIAGLGTMKQAATRFATSKASISKAARLWVDILDLHDFVSPHLKSRKRCDACRVSQKRSHWRKSKYKKKRTCL